MLLNGLVSVVAISFTNERITLWIRVSSYAQAPEQWGALSWYSLYVIVLVFSLGSFDLSVGA